jgi:hypothetical protein
MGATMTEQIKSGEQVRLELEEVEQTLQRLRAEQGTRAGEVGDQTDDATDLTSYEEEQALIENLEARRRHLTDRLNAS